MLSLPVISETRNDARQQRMKPCIAEGIGRHHRQQCVSGVGADPRRDPRRRLGGVTGGTLSSPATATNGAAPTLPKGGARTPPLSRKTRTKQTEVPLPTPPRVTAVSLPGPNSVAVDLEHLAGRESGGETQVLSRPLGEPAVVAVSSPSLALHCVAERPDVTGGVQLGVIDYRKHGGSLPAAEPGATSGHTHSRGNRRYREAGSPARRRTVQLK